MLNSLTLIKPYKLFFYKNNLFFANKFGVTKLDFSALVLGLQTIIFDKEIKFNTYKMSKYFINSKNYFHLKITKTVDNLDRIFKKKLVFFGVGFRYWLCNRNNVEFIVIKLGYSRDIVIKIPPDIYVISIKPTLLLLKSFNKSRLHLFTTSLLSLKKFDLYKGKGLKHFNENISLKLGKRN